MADANNVDYKSICDILTTEMERRKVHAQLLNSDFPALSAAEPATQKFQHEMK